MNGSLVVGDKGAARKTTADMLWVKVWTVPKPGHLAPANMPGTGSRVTLGNLPYRWGLYLGIAYGIGGFKYLFLAIAVFGKGDVSEGIGLFILTILMELAAVLVTVPPNNPVDLQSLKLIDFHLFRWSAQQRLFCVVGALTSMLKTSTQLRLENLGALPLSNIC